MFLYFLVFIFHFLPSNQLNAMQLQRAKPAESPAPQRSSTGSTAMLRLAQIAENTGQRSVARAAARRTDTSSPTAVFFRSQLTKKPAEKQKLMRDAAMLNPNRPSAAKKEAARVQYKESKKHAHENLLNIPRYEAVNNHAEAKRCSELYQGELQRARHLYKELLRQIKYENNETPIEENLNKEVDIKFSNKLYLWERELATYFWDEYKTSRRIDGSQDKAAHYLTKNDAHVSLAKKHYKQWLQFTTKETINETELDKKVDIHFLEIRYTLELELARQLWERYKSSKADHLQGKYLEHLNFAKVYYTSWMQLTTPSDHIEDLVKAEFELLQQSIQEQAS